MKDGKVYIGIDVGVHGAICIVDEKGVGIETMDMPTAIGSDNKLKTDAVLMAMYIREKMHFYDVAGVCIEHVSAMPKQGVTSSFNFGVSFGVCQGVVGALALPVMLVKPNVWKKEFNLHKKDKDYARTRAIQRWPHLADDLKRKKDCDRADALWLAFYAFQVDNRL